MSTFTITLRSKDNDSIRALRAALKVLLRRFGFRAVRIKEEKPKTAAKRRANNPHEYRRQS